MTVEEAAKLVVSAGIITPPDRAIGEYESDQGAIVRTDEKDNRNGKSPGAQKRVAVKRKAKRLAA